FEFEIKKSRFISLAFPVTSREQALLHLDEVKTQYLDARHHCWAYVVGNPNNAATMAANDDGEPSGTAGKPILNVLMHKQIGDIMLIVVRYFGGIKLGAGGLTRAYSQAADGVVQKLSLIKPTPMKTWQFACDFAQEQYLRHFLEQNQGELIEVNYSNKVVGVLKLPTAIINANEQLIGQGIRLTKVELL
ncbi:MAG: YigZ family protein, partial [Venatoribacter sp.]